MWLFGAKVLKNQSVGNTSTQIAHGLPFTPAVYAIVPKHASSAVYISVVGVDATNVTLIASTTGVTADIYLGPQAA